MAFHKKYKNIPYDYIIPFQTGTEETGKVLGKYQDNTLENISCRNSIYSELTALYWLWKNSKDDFVGLCHYRRFFEISSNEINHHIADKKVIVPKIAYLGRSIKNQYAHNHNRHIWDTAINVLEEKYPEYYISSKSVFAYNSMYPFNMIICGKEFLDAYSTWLFKILFEVEKIVRQQELDNYQQRYAGFLAERLLTLFLMHNNIEIIEKNIINGNKKKVSQSCTRILRNRVFYLIFGKKGFVDYEENSIIGFRGKGE